MLERQERAEHDRASYLQAALEEGRQLERARTDEEKARADEEKARADEEKARADEERARADEANLRANEEKARAERYARKLAELGIEP
jgi:hypothetical protein